MLPAQHQGPEPQAEHGFGCLLHLGENGLRVAEGNLNGTKIGKVEILQIQVELRAIGLQASAHLSDGGGAEAGARAKGGGAVIRHTKQANAAVGRVATGSHENGSVAVKQTVEKPTRRLCGHGCSSRSTKAGMASMAPLCQRGDQISQPAAMASLRSGSGVR